MITWRRSGPVVVVDVTQGLPTYACHAGDPVTCVTVTNTGRAPVTVNSWGLRLPDGQTMFVQQPFPGSDKLPYRLEQGASGTWRVESIQVAETCRAQGVDYADLVGFVNLATGETVYAAEGNPAWARISLGAGRQAVASPERGRSAGLDIGRSVSLVYAACGWDASAIRARPGGSGTTPRIP